MKMEKEIIQFETYCNSLIESVKNNLGIDVVDKSRKQPTLFTRYVLTENFISKLDFFGIDKGYLSLKLVGKLLNQERTTVYHSLKVHKKEIENRNDRYLEVYNKVYSLIDGNGD
jgi:hypothetical protein